MKLSEQIKSTAARKIRPPAIWSILGEYADGVVHLELERSSWAKSAKDNFNSFCDIQEKHHELLDKCAQLEKALGEIAHSPHCMYEANEPGMYGIGVADGHRCAAKTARKALGDA